MRCSSCNELGPVAAVLEDASAVCPVIFNSKQHENSNGHCTEITLLVSVSHLNTEWSSNRYCRCWPSPWPPSTGATSGTAGTGRSADTADVGVAVDKDCSYQ